MYSSNFLSFFSHLFFFGLVNIFFIFFRDDGLGEECASIIDNLNLLQCMKHGRVRPTRGVTWVGVYLIKSKRTPGKKKTKMKKKIENCRVKNG